MRRTYNCLNTQNEIFNQPESLAVLDDPFCPAVAQISEVLGSVVSYICNRGCACTVQQTVQRPGAAALLMVLCTRYNLIGLPFAILPCHNYYGTYSDIYSLTNGLTLHTRTNMTNL